MLSPFLNTTWTAFPEILPIINQVAGTVSSVMPVGPLQSKLVSLVSNRIDYVATAYLSLFSKFGTVKDADEIVGLATACELLNSAISIERNPELPDDVNYVPLLLSIATQMATKYNNNQALDRQWSHVVRAMTEGFATHVALHHKLPQTPGPAFTNIESQSPALVGLACYLGAYKSSGSEKIAMQCQLVGMNEGFALDINEEAAQYTIDNHRQLSTTIVNRLNAGDYGLAVALSVQADPAKMSTVITNRQRLSDHQRDAFESVLTAHQITNRLHEIAQQYLDQALITIHQLPGQPEREILLRLSMQLIK